jgi:hypothetical protein
MSWTEIAPRTLARIAGALYLVNIVAGAFAIGYVHARITGSDPASTLANLQAHELLYRYGLAAHVVVVLTNVPLAVIFYELFQIVNRRLALIDAALILVATAIEAAGILSQVTPLTLLDAGPGGFSNAQLATLVSAHTGLATPDYDLYTAFYGIDILCFAYLVYRSNFLPRTIGVLLAIDGFAYLINAFTDLLSPSSADHLSPWINLPAPIGEGSLTLWLLFVGLNAKKWQTRHALDIAGLP